MTAFVSAIAAILTLVVYLLFAGDLSVRSGNVDLLGFFFAQTFLQISVLFVVLAGIIGFTLGPERIANLFSFFWGTHSFWARLGAFLEDKLDMLRTEHKVQLWLLVPLLFTLAVTVVVLYARP